MSMGEFDVCLTYRYVSDSFTGGSKCSGEIAFVSIVFFDQWNFIWVDIHQRRMYLVDKYSL